MRVFFTGAFRKPRELNWVIGSLLLLLGTLEGFTGYSLPDDLLSGTGIRAADGFMKSMPVVGTYMSFFLFGGEFPGDAIIPRLYTVHVLLIPGVLLALIGAHMLLLVFHKHTQWPGPGRTERQRRRLPDAPGLHRQGRRLLLHRLRRHRADGRPADASTRSGGSGPTTRPQVTAGSQPDWYMGWPDGALRIMPGLGDPPVGLHAELERLPADHRAARPDVHDPADAAVPGGLDHRRQARAPPAPAPAQRADPHRPDGRADDLLRHPLGAPAATTSWRSSSA